MKKNFSVFLIIIVLLNLVGCNSTTSDEPSIPQGMPEYTYNIATKAIEIIDKYFEVEILEDNAIEKLEDLQERISKFLLTTRDEYSVSIKKNIISIKDSFSPEYGKEERVQNARNNLAVILGLPQKDYLH